MKPFDLVILAEPLPELGLRKGTRGAIVEDGRDGLCWVEFFDRLGRTLAVEVIAKSRLRRSKTRFPIQHVGAPESAMRGWLRDRPLAASH